MCFWSIATAGLEREYECDEVAGRVARLLLECCCTGERCGIVGTAEEVYAEDGPGRPGRSELGEVG